MYLRAMRGESSRSASRPVTAALAMAVDACVACRAGGEELPEEDGDTDEPETCATAQCASALWAARSGRGLQSSKPQVWL